MYIIGAFGLIVALIGVGVSPAGAQQLRSTGSGFVVNAEHQAVTNSHVVRYGENNEEFCPDLIVPSGPYAGPARLLAEDRGLDLALVQLSAPEATFAAAPTTGGQNISHLLSREATVDPLTSGAPGHSRFRRDAPRKGEDVLALGYPIASLIGTDLKVTRGVHSGTARGRMQHSAAINSGNSGGPLVDANGLVVGVNVAGVKVEIAQGIQFAVPGAAVQDFLTRAGATFHAEAYNQRPREAADITEEATNFVFLLGCVG